LIAAKDNKSTTLNYDKEKYREKILDATEMVLRTFGCERIVYWGSRKRKGKW
jgi:hypothetical protein